MTTCVTIALHRDIAAESPMSSIRRFIENSEVTTHAHSIQAVNGGKTSGSFPSISPLLASISAHYLPAVSLDLSLRCLYPMLQADSTFYLLGSEHQARRVTRRREKWGVANPRTFLFAPAESYKTYTIL